MSKSHNHIIDKETKSETHLSGDSSKAGQLFKQTVEKIIINIKGSIPKNVDIKVNFSEDTKIIIKMLKKSQKKGPMVPFASKRDTHKELYVKLQKISEKLKILDTKLDEMEGKKAAESKKERKQSANKTKSGEIKNKKQLKNIEKTAEKIADILKGNKQEDKQTKTNGEEANLPVNEVGTTTSTDKDTTVDSTQTIDTADQAGTQKAEAGNTEVNEKSEEEENTTQKTDGSQQPSISDEKEEEKKEEKKEEKMMV